jgi:hypothetical protein
MVAGKVLFHLMTYHIHTQKALWINMSGICHHTDKCIAKSLLYKILPLSLASAIKALRSLEPELWRVLMQPTSTR